VNAKLRTIRGTKKGKNKYLLLYPPSYPTNRVREDPREKDIIHKAKYNPPANPYITYMLMYLVAGSVQSK
jgi:hypothetical protein